MDHMESRKIIGAIMFVTGMTIPEYAKSIGYSKVAVYSVINGISPSPVIRAKIAADTCLPITDLWPETNKEAA